MDSTAAQSTATLATGLPKENESVLSRCQFDCRGISKRRINPRYPVTSAAKAATSLRSTRLRAQTKTNEPQEGDLIHVLEQASNPAAGMSSPRCLV